MNSAATTNNVEQFPSSPKPQTSREVIHCERADLLIEQLEQGHSEAPYQLSRRNGQIPQLLPRQHP